MGFEKIAEIKVYKNSVTNLFLFLKSLTATRQKIEMKKVQVLI